MARTRAKLINYRVKETEPDLSYTASATECTGLMRTPADPSETESLSDIYDVPLAPLTDHHAYMTGYAGHAPADSRNRK